MKWLFGLLLLASLAFFAFMQWGRTGANPSLQPPLNAEKIRLLPIVIAPVSAVQPAAQTSSACMEWGDFSGSDLTRATAAVSMLQLGNKLAQRQMEHVSGYWVYIPPLKNSAEVGRKIAQIKELGLEEYFVVQEAGKWRNAISLGVFSTEEAAHKFLESITAKGLKTAKAGERMSKYTLTVFVLKDADTAVMAKMATLQKDFPGSELKTVECTKAN